MNHTDMNFGNGQLITFSVLARLVAIALGNNMNQVNQSQGFLECVSNSYIKILPLQSYQANIKPISYLLECSRAIVDAKSTFVNSYIAK